MRILLTGARAPAALDLSRRFYASGHTVFVADSLRFGMTMFSRCVSGRFVLPRPVDSSAAYLAAMQHLIARHQIDLLIPTCEEVFYISRHRDQFPCDVLVDDFETLAAIHNKFVFSQNAGNLFAAVPETHLLEHPDQCRRFEPESADWVFKPVFSRFATRTLIGPQSNRLSEIQPTAKDAWVAQRRVNGQEYSTYSVAKSGRLLAHSCYVSRYRAGQGSGIYFVPVTHSKIESFVRCFVEQFQFTGQIGFDLIEGEDGAVFAIEGNPRATSGVHLFSRTDRLSDALTTNSGGLIVPSEETPVMVEFAMPFWGLLDAARRQCLCQFFGDMLRSRCASFSLMDPLPSMSLPVSLLEIAWIAASDRCSLLKASTLDIEWNGESL